MARNVKIEFPQTEKPYRGFITKLRQCLDEAYDFLLHSPKAKAEVRANIEAFATAIALPAPELPATTALVSTGATFAGVTGSGTKATITIAGGVITAIALSA